MINYFQGVIKPGDCGEGSQFNSNSPAPESLPKEGGLGVKVLTRG